MAYNPKDEPASRCIKDFICMMDSEDTDNTLDINVLECFFTDKLRDKWTSEENLIFRIRVLLRQCLNQLGYYAIGNGKYYNISSGTSKEKRDTVIENQSEDIKSRVLAMNKKKLYRNKKGEPA